MQVYSTVSNHAIFGGDARDTTTAAANAADGELGLPAGRPAAPAEDERKFAGMSAVQRYELDTFGVLHLRGLLSPAELAVAQSAFDRSHAEPSLDPDLLEALAAHPALLPLLLELCEGAPHLVSADTTSIAEDVASGGSPLHCEREHDHRRASYVAEAPGCASPRPRTLSSAALPPALARLTVRYLHWPGVAAATTCWSLPSSTPVVTETVGSWSALDRTSRSFPGRGRCSAATATTKTSGSARSRSGRRRCLWGCSTSARRQGIL